MSREWGKVTNVIQIATGIKNVSCEGHGGIIVSESAMAKNKALSKLKDYPEITQFRDGKGFSFEEDCDASIILFCLGKEKTQSVFDFTNERIDEIWNGIVKSLISYNPDIYTYLTGKGLSIFDSSTLLERHIVECGHETYKFCGVFSYKYCDIAHGFNVICVYSLDKPNSDERRYFELSEAEFNELQKNLLLPIDISGYTEVSRPKAKEFA